MVVGYENTCSNFHGINPKFEQPRPPGTNVVAIVGATATGKTTLSLELAEAIREEFGTQSEVVCIDTKTARKGMQVGTAAPSEAEQSQVPHHMLEMLYPEEPISRWAYQPIARSCIRDITSRDKLPLLVGGSLHLMEALVYYDRHLYMGRRRNSIVWKLGMEMMRDLAVTNGFGGPFEDTEERLRNHLMERYALWRFTDRPPHPGTLLLGVHREPDEHEELIRRRTEAMYPLLVNEFEALLLRTNGFYTDEEKTTIGYGDFHEIVNEGLHPIDSIFRRTLALADWQNNVIRRHMPHVQWVRSADEALAAYREHQKGLRVAG